MSVNQNDAIPAHYRHEKWGKNYFKIDFELSDRLSAREYESQYDKDLIRPIIGVLEIGNHKIPVTQKELEKIKETITSGINTVYLAYRVGNLK